MWETLSLYPEERGFLISKNRGTMRGTWTNSLARFPLVYVLAVPHLFLSCHVFPQLSTLHPTWSKHAQGSPFLCVWRGLFISSGSLRCHIKLALNRFLCFALVHLDSVSPIDKAPARGPRTVIRKTFSSHSPSRTDLSHLAHLVTPCRYLTTKILGSWKYLDDGLSLGAGTCWCHIFILGTRVCGFHEERLVPTLSELQKHLFPGLLITDVNC